MPPSRTSLASIPSPTKHLPWREPGSGTGEILINVTGLISGILSRLKIYNINL